MPALPEAKAEAGVISVLLPSRGRPDLLADSIASLLTRAAPNRVEVRVALDGDDPTWQEAVAQVGHYDAVSIFVGERHGYEQLHRYYNDLAEFARGSWLLLWNDDAIMETNRWDELVESHDHRWSLALNFTGRPQEGAMNLFPCVSRAWYETLGHISLSPHCDTWIQDASRAAGCEVMEPRIAVHHRRDEIDDATKRESLGSYATTSPAFYSPEMQGLLAEDVRRLR